MDVIGSSSENKNDNDKNNKTNNNNNNNNNDNINNDNSITSISNNNNYNSNSNNNISNIINSTYTSTTKTNVTKYRNYGSEITIFTVVTTWHGCRSSVSFQYHDFLLLDGTVRKELEYVPNLLCQMPSFPSEKIFFSDSNSLKKWGDENDFVPKNVPRNLLWSTPRHSSQEISMLLTDGRNRIDISDNNISDNVISNNNSNDNNDNIGDDNGSIKHNILNNYMIALSALLDHTPYLHTFLDILEVLPPTSNSDSLTSTDIR